VNLTSFARDAMPKGGRLQVETTEVTLGEEATRLHPEATPGRYVSFSVSDTGGGIPSEVLPKILELLFTPKREGKGVWMRLENVAGIVKQHRSLIKLDNRPGEGVTFHVFLAASLEAELMPTQVKPDPRGGKETIILVEDEVTMRKLVRKFLERHGYQVLEAANGIEALQCWEERPKSVSLLLTNLELPGTLSGQELARQLVAKQPELKADFVVGREKFIRRLIERSVEWRNARRCHVRKCRLAGGFGKQISAGWQLGGTIRHGGLR
jgi:two-component system cell cycle sensor histidine kinase/response regulator CckA